MIEKFLPILGVAMAFLLPSCLQHETTITLNKDGSGTITEEMFLGAQMVGMLEMAKAQGAGADSPLLSMKNEAKAKERAKSFGEGVTFVKSEDIKKPDGSQGVRVTYTFTDINKISLNPAGGISELDSIKPGTDKDTEINESKATFNYADGILTILPPQPEGDEGAEAAGNDQAADFDPNDPQAQMAAQMMKGMKMGAKIKIPAGIAETNATYHEGDTITLFEMNMDEVVKNPGGLGALQKLEGIKDPDAMTKAMKNIKGIKYESQKKVTATLK